MNGTGMFREFDVAAQASRTPFGKMERTLVDEARGCIYGNTGVV